MEVIISKLNNDDNNLSSKVEVLNHLEQKVKEWMHDHISKRRLWFSSDYLPADEKMNDDKESVIKKLRERVRGIKDSVRVAVAINLLTEEGLPHFHRIIAKHLGDESFWSKWNNMWTAEEDRHGGVLRDYARDSRLFSFREIELMQFHYQESGFNPNSLKSSLTIKLWIYIVETHCNASLQSTYVARIVPSARLFKRFSVILKLFSTSLIESCEGNITG